MSTILNIGQNYRITGGSDRYLFSLEKLLKKNNHNVIPFATYHPHNNITEWSSFFPKQVNFESPTLADIIKFIYNIQSKKNIKKILKIHRPNIAHFHIYYGQLSSSIISPLKKAKIPIVQTLHEYKIICPTYSLYSNGKICEQCNGKHFWQAILKKCNKGSFFRSALSSLESYVSKYFGTQTFDHYIAVSNFLRKKVIDMGLPEKKVTTIYNFINSKSIKPSETYGEYFLYFGRFEKNKGVFTLLNAIESLPKIPFVFVGEGSEKEKIVKYIKTKKISNVKIFGFKIGKELHDLIKGSICTIAPSEWYETFGLTLIESFALGIPVIASSIGGMTEVVTEGIDGLLFPPGNVNELKEKIRWMYNNRKFSMKMGKNGRKKVESRFNEDVHYQKIKEVYRKFAAM